jgi:Uncharacterized conserved protein
MNSRTLLKIAVLLLLVGAVCAVLFSPLRQHLTIASAREWVTHTRASVHGVWWAPLVLIVTYAVGCVFAIPASIFVIVSGALWGWKLGGLYATAGGLLGAIASYFVGRFLGEGLLHRFGRAGQMVMKQAKNAGFQSMLIVRLIPGPPFAVWNYGAGVAGVPFRDYVLATAIGILPSHMIFAYSADAIFSGTMTEGEAIRRLAIVGALLIGMVVLTSALKKRVTAAGKTTAGDADQP